MARGLNKVMLIGNVGREPEMRFTAAGKPFTSFSVAVSRRWMASNGQRREETEWFNVVAWGNLAEICERHVNKGQQIYVEGRLQTRKWENEQGFRQFRTDVVASEVTILEPRHHRTNSNHSNDKYKDDDDHDSSTVSREETESTF